MHVNVISAVQLCISTKNVYPGKCSGDKTQCIPSTSKSRGNVPLSTHGSMSKATGR